MLLNGSSSTTSWSRSAESAFDAKPISMCRWPNAARRRLALRRPARARTRWPSTSSVPPSVIRSCGITDSAMNDSCMNGSSSVTPSARAAASRSCLQPIGDLDGAAVAHQPGQRQRQLGDDSRRRAPPAGRRRARPAGRPRPPCRLRRRRRRRRCARRGRRSRRSRRAAGRSRSRTRGRSGRSRGGARRRRRGRRRRRRASPASVPGGEAVAGRRRRPGPACPAARSSTSCSGAGSAPDVDRVAQQRRDRGGGNRAGHDRRRPRPRQRPACQTRAGTQDCKPVEREHVGLVARARGCRAGPSRGSAPGWSTPARSRRSPRSRWRPRAGRSR